MLEVEIAIIKHPRQSSPTLLLAEVVQVVAGLESRSSLLLLLPTRPTQSAAPATTSARKLKSTAPARKSAQKALKCCACHEIRISHSRTARGKLARDCCKSAVVKASRLYDRANENDTPANACASSPSKTPQNDDS